MPEDIKTKMMLPFKPPITITNATEPGDDDEQVPVPIHIIVDNAADFPCGGGGGGEFAVLSFGQDLIADIGNIMDDPSSLNTLEYVLTPDVSEIPPVFFADVTVDEPAMIPVPIGVEFQIVIMHDGGTFVGGGTNEVYMFQDNVHVEEHCMASNGYEIDGGLDMLITAPISIPSDYAFHEPDDMIGIRLEDSVK